MMVKYLLLLSLLPDCSMCEKVLFRWSIFGFSHSCLIIPFLSLELTQSKAALPSTRGPSRHLKTVTTSLFAFGPYVVEESSCKCCPFCLGQPSLPCSSCSNGDAFFFKMPSLVWVVYTFYPRSLCIGTKTEEHSTDSHSHLQESPFDQVLFILALAQNTRWMD